MGEQGFMPPRRGDADGVVSEFYAPPASREWAQRLPVYVGTKEVRAGLVLMIATDTVDRDLMYVYLSASGVFQVVTPSTLENYETMCVAVDAKVFARGRPENGKDWLVVYPDGYVSWSPAAAFAAYRRKPSDQPGPLLDLEMPPRLKRLAERLLTVEPQVVVAGEADGDRNEFSACWEDRPRELSVVRFAGPEAAFDLADYLAFKFRHDLALPGEDPDDGTKPATDLKPIEQAPALMGGLATLCETKMEPTAFADPNAAVVRTMRFRTQHQPGKTVPVGLAVVDCTIVLAFPHAEGDALAWTRQMLGQHFLIDVRPLTEQQNGLLIAAAKGLQPG